MARSLIQFINLITPIDLLKLELFLQKVEWLHLTPLTSRLLIVMVLTNSTHMQARDLPTGLRIILDKIGILIQFKHTGPFIPNESTASSTSFISVEDIEISINAREKFRHYGATFNVAGSSFSQSCNFS